MRLASAGYGPGMTRSLLALAFALTLLAGCGGGDDEGSGAGGGDGATKEQFVLEDLRAVEAPEELREEWSRFLDGIQEAFDKFPELADATRDGDREKLEELTADFTRIASDTRPFAERNGLEDCLPEQQA